MNQTGLGFEFVKRGYDPEQVDRTLQELNRDFILTKNQLEELRAQLTTTTAEVDRLSAELDQTGAPSFAGLGAKLEHTLRTAEEKAAELVSTAEERAAEIMRHTSEEAERARDFQARVNAEQQRQAETKIQFLIQEAEFQAEQTLKTATEKAERLVNEALEEAASIRGTVATEAAELRSSSKRDAEMLRTHANLEANEIRTVAIKEVSEGLTPDTLLSQEIRQDLEVELAARRFEAEKEYLAKHQDAVASTRDYLDQANNLLQEVIRRLNEKRLEADIVEAQALSEAKQRTLDSTAEAESKILEAEQAAQDIVREARNKAKELVRDAENGLKHLREEEKSITIYFEALENLLKQTAKKHQKSD